MPTRDTVSQATSRWVHPLALLLVCSAASYIWGPRGQSYGDAQLYNRLACETVGGSWLMPTMNGALRLTTPPLPTWAVAVILSLVGPTDNLALLRLPAALMSTLLFFSSGN